MEKIIAAVALILNCLSLATVVGQSPVAIAVDAKAPGVEIPPDFNGLAFEMECVLPNWNESSFFTSHLFRPTNLPLITLFKTLGIKSLRVGGSSADSDNARFLDDDDADNLFAFAKAAGVKVIYTFRFAGGNPKYEAKMARYIQQHYQPQLEGFAIGNEPDMYFGGWATNYPRYRAAWERYVMAITSAVPTAKFCGPGVTGNGWARDYVTGLVRDFGGSGLLKIITWHQFTSGYGPGETNTVAGRDELLSPALFKVNQRVYDSFASVVLSNGLSFRLEEANSFWCGGAKGVSDTYASALWGVDYLYWWATHQAGGINIQGGDWSLCQNKPAPYSPFWSTAKGYDIHPLSYGIKVFDLGSHGRWLPLTIVNGSHLNLSAYAVRDAGKNLFVTIINKEHDTGARDAHVTISLNENISEANTISLIAPNKDVAVKTGETLGGAPINENGSWHGVWQSAPVPVSGQPFILTVPAASAVVVKFLLQ